MSSPTVLVTGATGSVGRPVVDGLLAAGHTVRALTRRPADAALPNGVDVRAGDLTDPDTVTSALPGVDRLYLFPTGDLTTITAAARRAGVAHIVLLSSASVTYAEPDPSSRLHQAAEDAVLASRLPHTFLRPGAFMSNDLAWTPEITTAGTVSTAYPDAATAPIDERDIAAVALAALLDPDTLGSVVDLTGPESLSQRRRVELLAHATGRPLQLVELTPDQARQQMSHYLPPEAVELILGVLAKAPTTAPTTPAPRDVIRRDPHTYLDWASTHRTTLNAGDRGQN